MKKKIGIVILMFVIVVVILFFYHNGLFVNIYNVLNYNEENISDVSIINLITTPKDFNKKHIRLEGVLEWGFESCGIYLTIDDYNYGITKNAVWLDIDDEMYAQRNDELNKMNGKYVIVEGVFNSDENGHFDMYSGSIENVTRLELWKSREERMNYID